MTRCTICNVSCYSKPLYRNNPTGIIPADWRCIDHLDKPPDKTIKEIAETITKDNEENINPELLQYYKKYGIV